MTNNILPLVNENDISTTLDQVFGDNDQLSAHVANYTRADLLVILSDIDGYYDKNPSEYDDAKIIKELDCIPEEALQEEFSPNSPFATGGIVTKLKAAQYLMDRGQNMFLCNGYDLTAAEQFLLEDKHEKGTLFKTKKSKLRNV